MFDWLYEQYARWLVLRVGYQIGFVIAWALWASISVNAHEATWLVFGWLPAVFWPVQLIGVVLWHLFGIDYASVFGFPL